MSSLILYAKQDEDEEMGDVEKEEKPKPKRAPKKKAADDKPAEEDGEGEALRPPLPPTWWEVDLRAAGTLRLMFSSASRRSAWKSGCRNVQLYGGWLVVVGQRRERD